MDPAFVDKLRTSRVMLITNLDVVSILPYLIQHNIFTQTMDEVISSKVTRQSKVSEFLSILQRRGPNAKRVFLDALRLTNQSFIADELEGTENSSAIISPPIFTELARSLIYLKPGEQVSDRHGTVLLTSTQTFTNKSPVSKLGERELPFLFAVKAFGYSHDTVLGWPLAPSKNDFERSLEIYEKEIADVKHIVRSLDFGGIHLIVKPRDERLLKLLLGYSQRCTPFSISPDGLIHVIVPTLSLRMMSPIEVDLLCCLIHLMCFSDHKFIIRKSCPPKPNCYLLFRSAGMSKSVVIAVDDIKVIEEAIGLDESVYTPTVESAACPW